MRRRKADERRATILAVVAVNPIAALQHSTATSSTSRSSLYSSNSARIAWTTRKDALLSTKQLEVVPLEGTCETEVLRIIDEHEKQKRNLGPAFFFLDQFGYSSFSMDLVRRILGHAVCEVFSYLNWNLLHPFMTDQTKWAGITKAFGGDEWKSVLGLSGQVKEERFKDVYMTALRERGGAKYTFPFAMRDQHDRVIYWLFFCTNNIRGLEEMKRAMWTVDRSGGV